MDPEPPTSFRSQSIATANPATRIAAMLPVVVVDRGRDSSGDSEMTR
jgi:hypothetical protein